MSIAPESSRPSRWPIALIVAIALCAMCRAVGNDWSNYDDDLFLFRNPHYDPPTLASFGYYWTHGFRGLWTPVTHSAWWIIAKFSQIDSFETGAIRLNPWTFHAFNVLLHCAATALAFVLVRRIVNNRFAALVGAAVFAAHPVQVEAVAWACGTKDVLGAAFTMAAIVFVTSRGSWRATLAITFAALAMLSKPSAVVVPGMLIIYAFTRGTDVPACADRRSIELCEESPAGMPVPLRIWLIASAMGALAIPVTIIARRAQLVGDVPAVSLLARPLVALDAIALQVSHLVSMRWCADYGLTPADLLASPRRWWTWLVPAVLALAVWRSRDRVLIGGAMLFVIALLPNLGLAAFQFQVYSTVADRYAYPAMLGVAIVVARLVSRLKERRLTTVLAAFWVVGLCVLSYRQCATWSDANALWAQTLSVNDRSPLAHNNLGASLMARNDLRGALAHFETAAASGSSTDGFALLNLAQIHLRLGEPEAAADAVIRLTQTYRRRADFDAQLERQTVDRFASQIGRLDPAAAERLRRVVGISNAR